MNNAKGHSYDISDKILVSIIVTFIILTFLIGILVLSSGISIIFQNLFYIPITLACYYYTKRGFLLSIFVSLGYFCLMFFFSSDLEILLGAFIRVIIFVSVAAVVTYLTILRVESQTKLIASEEFNRNLVDTMPDLVIIVDQERKIKYANKLAATILGYSKEEMLGTDIISYFHEDKEKAAKVIANPLEYSDVLDLNQTTLVTRRGGLIHVAFRHKPLVFDDEPAILVLLADISDIKKIESTLKISNSKLHILSNVTRHDINNSLTSLMNHADLLSKTDLNPVQKGRLDKINNAAQSISEMISFTEEFDVIGENPPNWQDWHGYIESIINDKSWGTIIFQNELSKHLRIFSDPLVFKALYNIIENSFRHGVDVSTIKIYQKILENKLMVYFEDDGGGISHENKERIFERGFGSNTGLGMFLVKEILSMTEIDIKENGEFGHGARFQIEIPKKMYRLCISEQD